MIFGSEKQISPTEIRRHLCNLILSLQIDSFMSAGALVEAGALQMSHHSPLLGRGGGTTVDGLLSRIRLWLNKDSSVSSACAINITASLSSLLSFYLFLLPQILHSFSLALCSDAYPQSALPQSALQVRSACQSWTNSIPPSLI